MKRQPPSFVRFLDLSVDDLNCDLHVHTNRTDGEEEVSDIVVAAHARGLRRIAFTEHVRKETTWFKTFAGEVRKNADLCSGMMIFVGCEAKALDTSGSLDVNDEILDECDLVLGSVHRFSDGNGGFLDFLSLTPEECAHIEYDLAMGLMDSAPIHVLAHPGGMYLRRCGADFPAALMVHLMTKSLEKGIAIEINSCYIKDLKTSLELFAKINPYVSIGSDMHHLDHLGRCRDILVAERRFSQ